MPDVLVRNISLTPTKLVCTNETIQIDMLSNKTRITCTGGFYILHVTWRPKHSSTGLYEFRWGYYRSMADTLYRETSVVDSLVSVDE